MGRISFGTKLIFGSVLIWVLAVAYWMMLPSTFTKRTWVQITFPARQSTQLIISDSTLEKFMQSECVTMGSEPVFKDVISKLNLREAWSSESGERLPIDIVYRILRNMTSIQIDEDTLGIIEIGVTSKDWDEAENIATQIAHSYLERFSPTLLAADAALLERTDKRETTSNPSIETLRIPQILCGSIFVIGIVLNRIDKKRTKQLSDANQT